MKIANMDALGELYTEGDEHEMREKHEQDLAAYAAAQSQKASSAEIRRLAEPVQAAPEQQTMEAKVKGLLEQTAPKPEAIAFDALRETLRNFELDDLLGMLDDYCDVHAQLRSTIKDKEQAINLLHKALPDDIMRSFTLQVQLLGRAANFGGLAEGTDLRREAMRHLQRNILTDEAQHMLAQSCQAHVLVVIPVDVIELICHDMKAYQPRHPGAMAIWLMS